MSEPALPSPAPDLEVAEFGDRIVALVVSRRRAVLLEAGPALVLDSCRHGHDRDAVIAELADATGSTSTETSEWLDGMLAELARLGVVQPAG